MYDKISEVTMLKRFFLVFLCFILVLGSIGCTSNSLQTETLPQTDIQTQTDVGTQPPATGTQTPTNTDQFTQMPTTNATQIPTEIYTETPIGTETHPTIDIPISTEETLPTIETQPNIEIPQITDTLKPIETKPTIDIPSNTETQRPIETFPVTQEPTEAPMFTETQAPTEAPTVETQAPTQAPTEAPTATETQTPTEAPVVTETQAPTETQTEPATKEPTVSGSYVNLSSGNGFKIVYAKGSSNTLAQKIRTKLTTLDTSATTTSHYKLVTDATTASGSGEILVGLTNREESVATKETLKTYLDFTVAVLGNNIVIYANTEDRLEDAIDYFFSCLMEMNGDVYFVPTKLTYTDTYDQYAYPNFTIARKNINTFSIIIPASATQAESNLAEELQIWLAENTGNLIPIKKDSEAASANEIIIGKTNRSECSKYTAEYISTIKSSLETSGTKLIFITGAKGSYTTLFSLFKTKAKELNGRINTLSEIDKLSPLNNKKAIFIGNSFVYWGNCVSYIPYKNIADSVDIETRLKGYDNGYFNQICKSNEINMNVYNFTYGGQNLEWIYANRLTKLDTSFFADIDYVFISEAGQNEATFKNTVKKIAKLFPNAEEVVYLAHEYTFRTNATHIINALDDLAAEGMKIVSWGELVYDVHSGKISVPGAKLSYNKNSFIKNSTGAMSQDAAVISLSGNGDTFHQNPLSGYITAQMCFSVISGISAQGQKYDFCWDKSLGAQYDFDNFLKHQYNNGQTSNFVKIFNSASDMAGLQKLMDTYLAKYN